MKVNVKSIVKASLILVFLTILPVFGQQFIPSEFLMAFSMQGGFDLIDLLYRIAIIGVVMSLLVLIRGNLEKGSNRYLIISSVWKTFWLFVVFFILGIGHPETLGLAVLGGKAESTENYVTFDFRLFAGLATIIVVLMIARSIMIFQETKPKVTILEQKSNPDISSDEA